MFRAAARSPRGLVGLTLTAIVTLVAFVGPLLAPHGATSFVTHPFASASSTSPLGGDSLGRDVLSRVLDGGWSLLLMAAAATAFGVAAGAAAGMSAGYLGRWADGLIMRTVDVVLAFPALVFALLLVSLVGPKPWLIVLAVGFTHLPAVARVCRSATLDIVERDYVKAVELLGIRPATIMRREIMPNLISPLMVETGLRLTYSIVLMSGLSFLGFGQPPPAANWGYMIQENRIGLVVNPWSVLAPAALIALLTVGVNTFTDAIARVALGIGGRADVAIEPSTVLPLQELGELA